MKKLLSTLLLMLFAMWGHAQIDTVFNENFDTGTINMTAVGTPGWTVDPALQVSAPNSMNGKYGSGAGVGSSLTTPVLDFSAYLHVNLDFDHICKTILFDTAVVEVSVDAGVTWIRLTSSNSTYIGSPNSNFGSALDYKFSASTYTNPTTISWLPTANLAVPNNTWWKRERFELDGLLSNEANVMLRFRLADDGNGMNGNYGWNIDNVRLTAANCELIPPVINQNFTQTPGCFVVQPPVWQGVIYNNLGPFDVNAGITDVTGVGATELYYNLNGTGWFPAGMFQCLDSEYVAQIPGGVVGDTICWYIEAIDASSCLNVATTPVLCFIIGGTIRVPFCDNFDGANTTLWTPTNTGSSAWQLGLPAFGITNSPLSFPKAWDIDLNSGYFDNSVCDLTSPQMDFTGSFNPILSFWQNYNTDFGDGLKVQYSINNGSTWTNIGFQGDPNATNWWDDAVGWTGQSNGWEESTYRLSTVTGIPNAPSVLFRFKFTSNFSGNSDGHSIDDFCIKVPPPNDMGISSIISPSGSAPAGSLLPLQVNLENYGNDPQTTVNIQCTVGGVAIPVYTWTGSLNGGTDETVVMPDITIPSGGFDVCCWTELPSDTLNSNDTTCATLVGVPELSISYSDDFESGNLGWHNETMNGTSEWQFGTPAFGLTTGAHSPLTAWDVDLTSGYSTSAECYLYTPYFDFSNKLNTRLSFWHNYNTQQGGDGVTLELTTNAGGTWTVLGTLGQGTNWYDVSSIFSNNAPSWTGNSGGWIKSSYDLINIPVLNNNPTAKAQFRFKFTSQAFSFTLDGHSIDDFSIIQPQPNDVGIASFVSPVDGSAAAVGSGLNVNVVLQNFGIVNQTTVPIFYQLNGGATIGPINWTGTITPGQGITVNLPGVNALAGTNTLCAWTSLTGDADGSNDTVCISFIGVPTLTPTYCDDFEGGNLGWTSSVDPTAGSQDIWEFGTPNFGATTGAHSPVTAWDVVLNSAYNNDAFTYLTSPFFDLSQLDSCKLNFWLNYNTEGTWDGTRLEYTADNGISWNVLGSVGDPCATNWYTINSLNSSLLPAWENNSGGWINCKYKLVCEPALNNAIQLVQFRFVFTSDASVLRDGVSMDDFVIKAPSAHDVGITAIIQPVGGAPIGTTATIVATLINEGSFTQTSVPVYYQIDNLSPVLFTWTGILGPDQSTNITLPGFIVPSGEFTLCVYTALSGDVEFCNDKTCTDLIGVPTYTLTYTNWFTDNFDTTNTGWLATGTGTKWERGIPGLNGSLPSAAYTAPNVWDVNLNAVYGSNASTYLYTPFFDLSNAVDGILRFWMNSNVDNFGDGTNIEYSFDGLSWNLLGQRATNPPNQAPNPVGTVNWYNNTIFSNNSLDGFDGTTGNQWQISEYPIGAEPGMNNAPSVRFRFHFTSDGFGQLDGPAIDNFEIEIPVPLDVTPVYGNVVNPNTLIFKGDVVYFTDSIRNRGTLPITQVTNILMIDNTVIAVDQIAYSPALLKKTTQRHDFAQGWVSTPGFHDVYFITSFPNSAPDLNISNDTFHFTITVFDSVNTYPYCNGFENGPKWVALNTETYAPKNSWELGFPNQAYLNAPHSGDSAWTVDIDNNYQEADTSSLFSPVFTVSTNKCYKLTFYHKFKTERYQDGGALEYSLDFGNSWSNIDFNGTPNSSLYNYAFTTALSYNVFTKGWTGTSSGWLYSEKILRPDVNGHMIIRWKFAADYDSTQEGWTIDDMCFTDAGFCNPLTVEEINAGVFDLSQNYPNPLGTTTTFEFMIPKEGATRLYITDIMGQIVAVPVHDKLGAGRYIINFDAGNLAAGIYYYTLEYNNDKVTKKMVITR